MGDVVDLDAFRTRRSTGAEAPKARIRIVDDEIEFDHPELDVVLSFSVELAEKFATALLAMRHRILAKQQRDAESAKRDHVATADQRGRKLPALKLRGWAIDTRGGSPGSDDFRWVRMTHAFKSRIDAERARRDYLEYGYTNDCVRVVPVDSRGRVIPPERMPKVDDCAEVDVVGLTREAP